VYIINQKGKLSVKRLGREKDSDLQLAIEKQNWFAAELEDKKSFALFGCTVSPGFEFDDFELGKRNDLIQKFPQHSALIKRLTKSS
jgi:predicted cupin superfamily sugar epimerase